MFWRNLLRARCQNALAALLLAVAPAVAWAEESSARYFVDYPVAEQFCPPVDGFFDEVQRTMDRVRGHTFRHQPNGGYGLAVVDQIGDQHLLHLGADVGWYRVGDPVFAVANGVVRVSEGPPKVEGDKKKPKVTIKLEWGNVVAIEHRLADGKYATTIYGHLMNERLVKVGDVVHVGQQIGMIGSTAVNGGYKPHLHLGVREGRMAEPGRKLVMMMLDGTGSALEIAEVKEQDDKVVLKGGVALPASLQMGADGRRFDISRNGDNAEVPAGLLSYLPSPDFLIVGYGLSTEGWIDPILFLKTHSADVNPAPFELAKRRRAPVRTAAGPKDRG